VAIDAKFVRAESYFPTEGRLDDKFNGNFKLVVEVTDSEATIPAGAWAVGVLWKGRGYLLATNDRSFKTPARIELSYIGNPPTVADFLTALGEELPEETKSYSYSWITGFRVNEEGYVDPNGQKFGVTDEWNTELLVIVEPFPWEKVLMGAGIGAVTLGVIAVLARRPQYVRRGAEYVRERIPARV